jgi:hypothetical protein
MAETVSLSTPLAYALAYAAMGWHVLPLEPRAKAPLGRLVPRGMHDATIDPEVIRGWWQRNPQAGVGIALAQSGLVAVDVDPRNGGTDTFEQLQAAHGSLRSDVMAFTGGGGEHHVFLVPHGAAISLPGTLGAGIDLKANGYIVVEPSVHPSGKQYGWEASSSPLDGVVPSPLPDWLRSLRVELQQPTVRVGEVPVDPVKARDAREALYLLNADEHDQWVKAGMALHSTRWGHPAYAMWCAWAQQSSKFDSTDQRKRWESFHTDDQRNVPGITLAWVFAEAQRAGWVNPAARVEAAPAPAVQIAGLVLTIGELFERAGAVRWAVKGLIPQQGLGFIYGASGTFKSFLALDYALHRAYGMNWMGRRTTQAVPVYLAAEGGAGIMRRIQAWHKARSMDWRKCPMRVVVVPLTLRTQAGTLADAVKASGVACGDLIVDTMSQTFTGNENSNDEVAEFLRVLGTDLRDALHCTVTVVHHSGHSATERPRGASAIIANVDFALGVFRDEKEMLCTVEAAKVKDGERPEAQTFELSAHELGCDEDGDAITSLVATHINTAAGLLAAVQREGSAGRGGRNQVFLGLLQNGMPEKELRKVFYDAVETTDPEARKKAFYRARDWAVSNGFIEVAQGTVIVLKEIS